MTESPLPAAPGAASPRLLELCLSPGLGGLELYAGKTTAWLRRHGVACDSLVRQGGRLSRWLGARGIEHATLPRHGGPLRVLDALRLARFVERNAIDLVHMHWGKDLPTLALARKLCRRRFGIVYSRHMRITRAKHDRYHRWLYAQVDRFVAGTQGMRTDAAQRLPLPPAHLAQLYLGVEAPREDVDCAALRAQLGLPQAAFVVACVGRIEPGKGQHVLLEALGMLRERGLSLHGVFAGAVFDEGYRRQLEARTRALALTDRVRFSGFLDEPQRLMACSDVVVLTTFEETFGLVLVEAMQAGTPVVGTAAGGVPEIICDGDTGLLVPPGDPGALADALQRLFEDVNLRTRMAAQARRDARARFAVDGHYEALLRLFAAVGRGFSPETADR